MNVSAKKFDAANIQSLIRRRNALPIRGIGKGTRRALKPPRAIPPRNLERQYGRELNKIITALHELTQKHVINNLPHLIQLAGQQRPTLDSGREIRNDDFASEALRLILAMRGDFQKQFSDKVLQQLAEDMAVAVATQNKLQIMRIFEVSLGVNPFAGEPWLTEEIRNFSFGNVGLIKNVTEQYMNNVQNTVFSGARQGLRAEEIAQDIVDHDEQVAASRANLIARDQVNKFNGNLMQLRQTDAGVEKYVWRTSLDDRVRDSHAEKEGNEYRWDDPPSDTGHPGEDIQCRCYAEPVLDDLLNASDETG